MSSFGNFIDQSGVTRLRATGGGGGSSPVLAASVPITSAQILVLHTTPVILVPGVADKTIVALAVLARFTAGATPYSINGDLRVFLGATRGSAGTNNNAIDPEILTRAFSGITALSVAAQDVGIFNSLYADLFVRDTFSLGQPLQIDSALANTDGDGSLEITTLYVLV